jgi:hypothetical protein
MPMVKMAAGLYFKPLKVNNLPGVRVKDRLKGMFIIFLTATKAAIEQEEFLKPGCRICVKHLLRRTLVRLYLQSTVDPNYRKWIRTNKRITTEKLEQVNRLKSHEDICL